MGELGLLAPLLAWGVAGWIVVTVTAALSGSRAIAPVAQLVYLLGFALRAAISLVNNELEFFDAKLAGNLALQLYEHHVFEGHGILEVLGHEFGAQVLLNTPVWWLLGPSRESLLLSNAAVGSLLAPLAGLFLYRDFGWSAARRAFLIGSCYLGAFNFSLFGLRDPIICLAVTLFAVAGLRFWWGGRRSLDLGLLIASLAAALSLRPEMAYFLAAFVALPLLGWYLAMWQAARRNRRVFASGLLVTLPLAALAAALTFASTHVAAVNIGARSSNLLTIAEEDAEARFQRAVGDSYGGRSHLTSAEQYREMPVLQRVVTQTAGLIVLPFPWEITDLPRLLAFCDSLFLMALIGFALLNLRYAETAETKAAARLVAGLLLVFAIGLLGMGIIVSNAGNGFRMRISATPFLILAASLCPLTVRIRLFAHSPSRLPAATAMGRA